MLFFSFYSHKKSPPVPQRPGLCFCFSGFCCRSSLSSRGEISPFWVCPEHTPPSICCQGCAESLAEKTLQFTGLRQGGERAWPLAGAARPAPLRRPEMKSWWSAFAQQRNTSCPPNMEPTSLPGLRLPRRAVILKWLLPHCLLFHCELFPPRRCRRKEHKAMDQNAQAPSHLPRPHSSSSQWWKYQACKMVKLLKAHNYPSSVALLIRKCNYVYSIIISPVFVFLRKLQEDTSSGASGPR